MMGNKLNTMPGSSYVYTPPTRLEVARKNMQLAEHRMYDAANEQARAVKELKEAEAAAKIPCSCPKPACETCGGLI